MGEIVNAGHPIAGVRVRDWRTLRPIDKFGQRQIGSGFMGGATTAWLVHPSVSDHTDQAFAAFALSDPATCFADVFDGCNKMRKTFYRFPEVH